MSIHKEGTPFIVFTFLVFLTLLVLAIVFNSYILYGCAFVGFLLTLFMLRFFRFPKRELKLQDGCILAPADGTIVIIEEAEVKEYLNERRKQVSIFMSVWNVHINWIPLSGKVEYFRHHQGKYLVAKLPKSSELNERTTVVVNNGKHKVLFRQIAGFVARRIVTYIKEGEDVKQNQQLGFIKFGSRVDLFLPLDAEIMVEMNQKVVGTETVIARLP